MTSFRLVVLAVTMIATCGASQTLDVYNDKIQAMTYEWKSPNVTSTDENCPVPFEGTKCMDIGFDLTKTNYFYMALESPKFLPSKKMDASKYAYFQFAARIVPAVTNGDTVSFWCIHCDASKSKDLSFNGKAGFQPTDSWKVFNIPMSKFSGDPVGMISAILLNFGGGTGTGHLYLDDIKFTNSASGIATPSHAGEFPIGTSTKVAIYTLDGKLLADRAIEPNRTGIGDVADLGVRNLTRGTYLVRERALDGRGLWSERLLVVPR